jgi:hypothetical protein
LEIEFEEENFDIYNDDNEHRAESSDRSPGRINNNVILRKIVSDRMTPEFKLSSEENSNRDLSGVTDRYHRESFNVQGFNDNKLVKLRSSFAGGSQK